MKLIISLTSALLLMAGCADIAKMSDKISHRKEDAWATIVTGDTLYSGTNGAAPWNGELEPLVQHTTPDGHRIRVLAGEDTLALLDRESWRQAVASMFSRFGQVYTRLSGSLDLTLKLIPRGFSSEHSSVFDVDDGVMQVEMLSAVPERPCGSRFRQDCSAYEWQLPDLFLQRFTDYYIRLPHARAAVTVDAWAAGQSTVALVRACYLAGLPAGPGYLQEMIGLARDSQAADLAQVTGMKGRQVGNLAAQMFADGRDDYHARGEALAAYILYLLADWHGVASAGARVAGATDAGGSAAHVANSVSPELVADVCRLSRDFLHGPQDVNVQWRKAFELTNPAPKSAE